MSIYNKDENQIYTAYNINGLEAYSAFNKDGEKVFQKDGEIIKVCSYNVGGWYIGSGTNVPSSQKTTYESLQRSILSNNNFDIVVFEEYWNTFSQDGTTALSLLDDYYSSNDAINGNSQYGGRCISMNFPLLQSSNFAFSQQSIQGNTLVNKINIGGHDIYILGAHLDWQQQARQELQVRELIAYLSDKEYFILCGDFNSVVSTTEDRTSEEYIGVCKPFIDAGYNMANWKDAFIPTYYNGTSEGTSTSILCLDNIITSSNISISDVYTDTTKLTDGLGDTIDHIPIIATLTIPL